MGEGKKAKKAKKVKDGIDWGAAIGGAIADSVDSGKISIEEGGFVDSSSGGIDQDDQILGPLGVDTPIGSVEEDKDLTKPARVYPPITKPVITATPADRIPSVSMFQEVEVVAYGIGPRGYRFATVNNTPAATVWRKKMSGIAAMQLLRKIKAANKFGRLESKTLPQ